MHVEVGLLSCMLHAYMLREICHNFFRRVTCTHVPQLLHAEAFIVLRDHEIKSLFYETIMFSKVKSFFPKSTTRMFNKVEPLSYKTIMFIFYVPAKKFIISGTIVLSFSYPP